MCSPQKGLSLKCSESAQGCHHRVKKLASTVYEVFAETSATWPLEADCRLGIGNMGACHSSPILSPQPKQTASLVVRVFRQRCPVDIDCQENVGAGRQDFPAQRRLKKGDVPIFRFWGRNLSGVLRLDRFWGNRRTTRVATAPRAIRPRRFGRCWPGPLGTVLVRTFDPRAAESPADRHDSATQQRRSSCGNYTKGGRTHG